MFHFMRLPFIPCQRQRKEKYDKSTSASIHTNTALRLPAKPPKRTPAVSFSSPPPAAHLLFLLARQRKRRWGAETVCAHLGVKQKKKTTKLFSLIVHGAGDEARTRYLHLGKVALYQMSYARRTILSITGVSWFVNTVFENYSKNFGGLSMRAVQSELRFVLDRSV